jgi:small conductance mechanosensitive channel
MLLQVLEVSERLEGVLKSLIEHSAELGFAIIKAVIVFVVGRMIINLLNKLVKNILIKRNFDPSVKSFVSSLVNVTLTILLIISIVGALGVQTTSFAALLASAGVAVGMALSGNLSNFAGGLIVLLFKPYKVGDFIDYQGQSGTVREIQMFHTILKTTDNKVIYIPNGSLSSGVIVNYSNQQTRRIDWVFGVDYGTDYDHVKQVLETILAKETRILQEPDKPFIALTALADSSVNILVRVWVKSEDYWSVYFDMNKTVYEVFNKEGINFPFPQLTVHQA